MVVEPLDGEWPALTAGEARGAVVRGWELLAARAADPDPEVAAEARRLASEELRGAVRSGVGTEATSALTQTIEAWTDVERRRLREKLDEIRAYDGGGGARDREAIERLSALLAPRSYRERLRQQVGVWGAAQHRNSDGSRDEALAREGLEVTVPLREELDWLVSDEAV
jgi:hypothetical protein